MVATKNLLGGKRTKPRSSKGPKRKKIVKTVSIAKKYAKPGSKAVARDKLHKCSKVIKSGKHKGQCKVVLSKAGQKVRASMLARKGTKKKHTKKKKSKKK
jgi:hypothetical protein